MLVWVGLSKNRILDVNIKKDFMFHKTFWQPQLPVMIADWWKSHAFSKEGKVVKSQKVQWFETTQIE